MAKVGSLDIVVWVRNMKLDLDLACNCCGSNCILGTIVPCHQVKEVVSLRVIFEDKLRIYKNAQEHIGRFHAQFPKTTQYMVLNSNAWLVQSKSIHIS